MNRSHRLRLAQEFAAAHWAVLVLTQAVNFFSYLLPQDGGLRTGLLFLGTLPLLQAENLLAAGLLGVLAYLASGRLAGRVAFYLGYTALTAYVVVNQVVYKVYFDHYRLSMSEGLQTLDPGVAGSSFGGELDGSFALVLAAGVTAVGWLGWRHLVRPPGTRVAPWRPARLLPALGLLLLCGLPNAFSAGHHNLQHHPLTTLAQEATQGPPIDLVAEPPTDVPDATAEAPPSVDARVEAAAEAIRRGGRRPNVLLVVLESVGSRQLLGADGLPSPTDTPHLAELSRRAVVFDAVYSPFPATVRTHVALNTGGRALTWGSVYEMLGHEYEGPTLARAFRERGYRTALFSSQRLDTEAMDKFLGSVGYETLYDFAKDAESQVRDRQIHSWGAVEDYTLGKVQRWLDGPARGDKPFLLTYLTVATHHPYGVPPGYPSPHPDGDAQGRYRNALHYTDAALGRLLAFLARRKLDDNTLVAVTGDHGQAFATWHARNFTHKFHLYEENVRSFLMLAHPAIGGPIVSDRVGTAGDLLPTLAALAALGPADVPGKDLMAREFPGRIVFFHKNAYPEKWGLRDGRWKFIQTIRDRQAELYDLADDSTEQRDVAADQPERVRRYGALCRDWFARQNDEFATRLKDYRYPGGRPLRVDDWRAPGPKILTVGYRLSEKDDRFVEKTEVSANRAPVAWTRWVSDIRDRRVVYGWHSPSGKHYSAPLVVSPDWGTTYVKYPGPLPLEPGAWQLTLDWGGDAPLSARFTVAADRGGGP